MSDAGSPIPSAPAVDVAPAPIPTKPEFWRTPPPTSRLGRVAMAVGIGVFVVSITLAIVLGTAAGPHSTRNDGGFHFNFNVGDPDPTVNTLALAMLLHVLIGTGLGLWALIQGIVATATKRGRPFGIIAIVTAGLAPGLSIIAFFVATALNLPPS